MIVLGFILVFFIGVIVGAGIIYLVKTAQKIDIEIMLLQLMDKLKKDRKSAQMKMSGNTKVGQDMNYGKYVQADKTIKLIKELYGDIY